jgi:hypothetical protein
MNKIMIKSFTCIAKLLIIIFVASFAQISLAKSISVDVLELTGAYTLDSFGGFATNNIQNVQLDWTSSPGPLTMTFDFYGVLDSPVGVRTNPNNTLTNTSIIPFTASYFLPGGPGIVLGGSGLNYNAFSPMDEGYSYRSVYDDTTGKFSFSVIYSTTSISAKNNPVASVGLAFYNYDNSDVNYSYRGSVYVEGATISLSDVPYPIQSVTPVPEADTSAMLLMGLGVIGFMARRRKNTQA